jgi:DNA-binding Xre family transcriptional regulator
MGISWRFKSYLARKHQIYTATELQKRIAKKTGVVISLANLCMYVNQQPKRIELQTVEILCTALQCELGEFLSVTAKSPQKPTKQRKLSAKNTPQSKIGVASFPEPENYGE